MLKQIVRKHYYYYYNKVRWYSKKVQFLHFKCPQTDILNRNSPFKLCLFFPSIHRTKSRRCQTDPGTASQQDSCEFTHTTSKLRDVSGQNSPSTGVVFIVLLLHNEYTPGLHAVLRTGSLSGGICNHVSCLCSEIPIEI